MAIHDCFPSFGRENVILPQCSVQPSDTWSALVLHSKNNLFTTVWYKQSFQWNFPIPACSWINIIPYRHGSLYFVCFETTIRECIETIIFAKTRNAICHLWTVRPCVYSCSAIMVLGQRRNVFSSQSWDRLKRFCRRGLITFKRICTCPLEILCIIPSQAVL